MPDHLHYKPVPEPGILDAWLTSTNGLTTEILKNLAPGSERIAIEDIVNPPIGSLVTSHGSMSFGFIVMDRRHCHRFLVTQTTFSILLILRMKIDGLLIFLRLMY